MSIIQIFIEKNKLHIVLGTITLKGNKIPPASEGKFTNTHEQINGKSFEENKNRLLYRERIGCERVTTVCQIGKSFLRR